MIVKRILRIGIIVTIIFVVIIIASGIVGIYISGSSIETPEKNIVLSNDDINFKITYQFVKDRGGEWKMIGRVQADSPLKNSRVYVSDWIDTLFIDKEGNTFDRFNMTSQKFTLKPYQKGYSNHFTFVKLGRVGKEYIDNINKVNVTITYNVSLVNSFTGESRTKFLSNY